MTNCNNPDLTQKKGIGGYLEMALNDADTALVYNPESNTNKVRRVNLKAAIEAYASAVSVPVGTYHYSGTNAAISVVALTPVKLQNNSALTPEPALSKYLGLATVWNATTNELDLSSLNVGDSADIVIEFEFTASGSNAELVFQLLFSNAIPETKEINFGRTTFGDVGPFVETVSTTVVITPEIKAMPIASVYVSCGINGTIKMKSLLVRIVGAN